MKMKMILNYFVLLVALIGAVMTRNACFPKSNQ